MNKQVITSTKWNTKDNVMVYGMAALASFSFSTLRADPSKNNTSGEIVQAVIDKSIGIKDHVVWKVADPLGKDVDYMYRHIGKGGVMCWTNESNALLYLKSKTGKIIWRRDDLVGANEIIRSAMALDDRTIALCTAITDNQTKQSGYRLRFLGADNAKEIASQTFSAADLSVNELGVRSDRYIHPTFVNHNGNLYLYTDEGIIRVDTEQHTAETLASVDRTDGKTCLDWTFTTSGIYLTIKETNPSSKRIARVNEKGGFSNVDLYPDMNIVDLDTIDGQDLLVTYRPKIQGANSIVAKVESKNLKEAWTFDAGRLSTVRCVSAGQSLAVVSVDSYVDTGSGHDTEAKFLFLDIKTGKLLLEQKGAVENGKNFYEFVFTLNNNEYLLKRQKQGDGSSRLSLAPLMQLVNPLLERKSEIDLGNISDGDIPSILKQEQEGVLIHFTGNKSYKNGLIAIVSERIPGTTAASASR